MKDITEKQRRFVEAFSANGGNATAAARAAGYKQPALEGHKNIRKANIRAAVEALRLERTSCAIADRVERQEFWTKMMRDRDEGAKERLRASELLGRCQGDFLGHIEDSNETEPSSEIQIVITHETKDRS